MIENIYMVRAKIDIGLINSRAQSKTIIPDFGLIFKNCIFKYKYDVLQINITDDPMICSVKNYIGQDVKHEKNRVRPFCY